MPSQKTDQTWNATFEAVQFSLLELAGEVALSDARDEILSAAFRRLEGLRRSVAPCKPTDAHLARKYVVSERTVRNWRKAGCPFEAGQRSVLDWIAKRRYAPKRAEQKFAKQLSQRRWRHDLRRYQAFIDKGRVLKAEFQRLGNVPDWLPDKRAIRGKPSLAVETLVATPES